MKRILFVSSEVGHFTELERVAKFIQDKYEPVFVFAQPQAHIDSIINACDEHRWVCYDTNGNIILPGHPVLPVARKGNNWLLKQLRPIGKFLFEFVLFRFLNALYHRSYYLPREIFKDVDPCLLILCGENMAHSDMGYMKRAKKHGIKSLIVPYTISGKEEQATWMYPLKEFHMTGSFINFITGILFPRYVCRFKGRHLIRAEWYHIWSRKLMALSPRRAWCEVGGQADAVATESYAMRDFRMRNKVPRRKLILTGSMADDIMYESMQQPKRYDKPMLLVAFPPGHLLGGTEFEFYRDIVHFYIDVLGKIEGWEIVIRPHPKIAIASLSPLIDAGYELNYEDTASLIPHCDLYVSCVSATIRWAIACGKPVINYDLYNLNYSDYERVLGVLNVQTKVEFALAMQEFTRFDNQDMWNLKGFADMQKLEAPKWGCIDGHSGERILHLIDRMAR